MSASRGSGAGIQAIPAGSRKVVQSLKEIVSCPEAEIYATLKECNMDPNEAVNRLLSQDPFHEVKSKREKKKEGKDNSESRARGANNSSSRRSKNAADRQLGRGVSASYNASESTFHAKSTYKKENGSTPYTSYLSSGSDMSGNNRSRGPSGISNGASAESKGSFMVTSDVTPSVVQQASAYQSAWVGTPGQVSMADIVRMGRPHNKASNASRHNIQDHPKVHHSEVSSVEVSVIDEWPSIEKPAPALPEYTVDSELHPGASGVGVPSDSNNHHYEADEIQEREDDNIEASGVNDLGSVSISSREITENDSRGTSLFENELYKGMGSYHSEAPDFERHEDEEVDASVSSVTRNLQQLSVEKDDRRFPSEGSAPSVVIPDHLQVQVADCSHLSFGSFGAAISAPYSSGTTAPVPVNTNSEEVHVEADNSSAAHVETRNSEYYIDDSLRNAPDSNLFPRNGTNGASVGSYGASSAPQPEELKPESAEVAHQYPFPSNPGYSLDDAQRLNAPFSETSSQMQNLAPFSNVMQPYTNSLPSTLLTGNVHSARESDLQYSPFPVSHSISAKYGNSASSAGVSGISMSEALKTGVLSSTQAAPQAASGTSVATGPPLPQHIAVHPYSQHTVPMGPFANFGYPFLPPSYTYMPSAFQQSFAGSSAYHQTLAAVLPQYKSSVSVSSLPQSAAVPSGYGAFGSSTTLPGNYPMNPPAAPSGSTLSYDDVLSSQYKENSQLLSLQQNENPAMWLQGHSSRTVQAVPSNTYYNYPGQNQQASGFRQAQQQSQNYGAPGYPNFYHSPTLDQQQNPNTRDGAQGQPKQSQVWPNSY